MGFPAELVAQLRGVVLLSVVRSYYTFHLGVIPLLRLRGGAVGRLFERTLRIWQLGSLD
jgi:hypothetical protein